MLWDSLERTVKLIQTSVTLIHVLMVLLVTILLVDFHVVAHLDSQVRVVLLMVESFVVVVVATLKRLKSETKLMENCNISKLQFFTIR